MQELVTTPGSKESYRPMNLNQLCTNLKRARIWKCIEPHVIYALFYTMCTNKAGFLLLKMYLSCDDKNVCDPLFIGQYLLVPVNTIVKSILLDWMMQPFEDLYNSENYRGKRIKAEAFLRYSLLSELLQIVYKYGRSPEYKFKNDERLSKILNGKHGLQGKSDKNHVTLAIDGFMTIWLLTLPEKFKEWSDFQNKTSTDNNKTYPPTKVMDMNEVPIFPTFAKNQDSSRLHYNQSKAKPNDFDFLPKTWNLMKCFEYYFHQKELWTTASIEAEWNDVSDENIPEEEDLSQSFNTEDPLRDVEKGSAENVAKQNENAGVEEFPGGPGDITMFKQSSDDDNAGLTNLENQRKRAATTSHSISPSTSTPKKKRKSSVVFPAKALELVYKLDRPLNQCTGLLNDLHTLTKSTEAHTAIQDLQNKIDGALEIKRQLLEFAKSTKK